MPKPAEPIVCPRCGQRLPDAQVRSEDGGPTLCRRCVSTENRHRLDPERIPPAKQDDEGKEPGPKRDQSGTGTGPETA